VLLEPLVNLKSTLSLGWRESEGPRRISSRSACFFCLFFSYAASTHSSRVIIPHLQTHSCCTVGYAWKVINTILSPNTSSFFNCSLKSTSLSVFSVFHFLYFLHLNLFTSLFLYIKDAFGRFTVFSLFSALFILGQYVKEDEKKIGRILRL